MVQEAKFTVADAQKDLQKIAQEVWQIKEQFLGGLSPSALPNSLKFFLPDRTEELWQHFVGSLNVLAFQALLQLKTILERGGSKKHLADFFELMNKIQGTFFPLGLCPDRMSTLVDFVRTRLAHKIGADAVAVQMNSVARRRNILFVATAPLVRPFMKELIESIGKEISEKVSLDYASWIDGYDEEGGVKIEQWLEEGIHSPLLAADAVRYIIWNKRGAQKIETSAREEAAKTKHDLFFDCIAQQVRVAGKACTSKELPSQKATVAIMDALLTAEGHRLHNRALPESGYTKYRNEFQGKITGPLVALVKKRLKKDLVLKVEGTLTDFTVSLDPKGFDIAVVKKLG